MQEKAEQEEEEEEAEQQHVEDEKEEIAEAKRPLPPFFQQFLIDGLKFFYSVTHHMEDRQDEVLLAYFESFMAFVKQAFQLYPLDKPLLTEVCLRIVHVLMNLHENVLIVLLTEKPREEEKDEKRVLNERALMLLLSLFIENADERHLVHSGVMQPVPVVLARAARHIPLVKRALQEWILDNEWPSHLQKPSIPERFVQEFEEQDTVKRNKERRMATSDEGIDLPNPGNLHKRLFVRFLTDTNYELKSVTSEFMFVLCDEDAEFFANQVGFGSAAGLLAERGMFGPLSR